MDLTYGFENSTVKMQSFTFSPPLYFFHYEVDSVCFLKSKTKLLCSVLLLLEVLPAHKKTHLTSLSFTVIPKLKIINFLCF